MLITSLIRTGKSYVVERARLEHVMAEQDRANRFAAAGTTRFHRNFDPATAPSQGGNPAAAYANAAKQAVESVAGEIAAHYPLLGMAVDLRKDQVYLDVGRVW
jgi:hypothetical protein